MHRSYPLLSLAIGVLLTAVGSAIAEQPWIEHNSFEDFAAGALGCGGANIYVARSGRVEMIKRMDFNNDGHLDLFVANDHNDVEGADVLVYWGRPAGPRSLMPPIPDQLPKIKLLDQILARRKNAIRLPSDGGGRSTLADLNNDGYPEIIFCNFKHNYTVFSEALIYWNSRSGFDPNLRTELPTLLPGGVAAADFNRDGFVDLAFANRGNFEWQSHLEPNWHRESYIYWNGPMGFDEKRRTSIPTLGAVDCVADDLNGDGYPELLFVNNNRLGKSIYLYWGSPDGYSESRREIRLSADPVEATLADVDSDGDLDLILNHRGNYAEIFRFDDDSFEEEPWQRLETVSALDCEAADLNRDGRVDLVFANSGSGEDQKSFIYWGKEDGFSADPRTELPTLKASDAALADFNGDGWTDVAFSNQRSVDSQDVNSYIYWNGPDGFVEAHRSELLGFSPVAAEAGDLNRDGHQDLVLISHTSGFGGPDGIDSFIYWGNARHEYSPVSMTTLAGCGAVTAADLDQNGYVDFVGANLGVIYWGGQDGYTQTRIDPKEPVRGVGVAIADLNRDGHLDLVMTSGYRTPHPSPGSEETRPHGIIFWGDESGYDSTRKNELELQTNFSQSVNIADLNNDGFLDLIFPSLHRAYPEIYWGDASGTYGPDRHERFPGHRSSTIEIADLNGDGWLDLVFGGGWNVENWGRPTKQARIMWGSKEGFSRERSTVLEAFDSLEQSVADLNKDGFLDIVMTNYHAYFTRRLPAFIYWGGEGGAYSESRRTSLPAESSSVVTIADLNADGWMDLFVCNHVIEGDHTVGSNIFWGGPDGYSGDRRQWLPSFGPHFSFGWDVGNIHDRSPLEEYVSTPLETPNGKRPNRLSWTAQTPHRTGVKFQIRSASASGGLNDSPWVGPEGEGSYFTNSPSTLFLSGDNRWLQYRAILSSQDGGSTPYLDRVRIDVAD